MPEREPLTPLDLAEHLALLQRIRDQRTAVRGSLTAGLMALEQAYHGERQRAARRTRRVLGLAAAAALLVLAPLAWWLGAPHPTSLTVVASPAARLDLDTTSRHYVSQAEVEAQLLRLGHSLARELPARLADPLVTIDEVASSARALAASGHAGNGGTFGPDLQLASNWLGQRLPRLHGGELATALDALSMVAAETGVGIAPVREHGRRLVAETLAGLGRADDLTAPSTPVRQIADCGRFLALAPAFGIPNRDARAVREALVSALATRAADSAAAAELLAAQLFGFGDVNGRATAAAALDHWPPTQLSTADLQTMQQLAASAEPGVPAWTRFLLDLRRLARCAIPDDLTARANMLLCLASSSFVVRSCRYAEAVAFAQRQ